jgi:hypothetical protein
MVGTVLKVGLQFCSKKCLVKTVFKDNGVLVIENSLFCLVWYGIMWYNIEKYSFV